MKASSLWLLLCLVWPLCSCARASAQTTESAPQQEPPRAPATRLPLLRVPGSVVRVPVPKPAAGTCLDGSCEAPREQGLLDYARARPGARFGSLGPSSRRERFAYAGVLLGDVSAGLLIAGSITISVVDDRASERVTRGVWLGVTAVSAPLVALSAYLARKESGFKGYPGLRRFGWLSYALAVADGAFLWSGAFRHERGTPLLTISAGVLAALSVLPHALEAASAGRSLRMRRVTQRLRAGAGGLTLRF